MTTDWVDNSGASLLSSSKYFEFFMINDILFYPICPFFCPPSIPFSLCPYSPPAFTNVQLLEKFKETIQLLVIVVKTMKTPQSKVSAQIRTKAVKMQTEPI